MYVTQNIGDLAKMLFNPNISIIMPFLNAQSYIREAIESILSQTYTGWELLMVDDGSTDGSSEIARQYAQQYPEKIRYFEHEGHQNRGASASRNLALRNARGKYIAFLDGDDVWLPFNLEHFVKILDANPQAAMAYGPTQWWYSWTGKPEDRDRDYVCKLGIEPNTLVQPPGLFIPFFLSQSAITPCTCSLLVRREVVESIGNFEEDFRFVYTDQVFYAKLALQAPIFVTHECGALYRQHSASSCAIVEKTGQAHSKRLKFLNWLEQYLSEQSNVDPEIWQALQNTLWAYRYPALAHLSNIYHHPVKHFKSLTKRVGRMLLPPDTRRWLRAQL